MTTETPTSTQETTSTTAKPEDAQSQPATTPNADPANQSGESTQPVKAEDNATGDKQEDKADDKKDEASGAPEKYEFKAPEGMTLNEEVTAEFSEMAKGLNLNQEQAQAVADLGIKLQQKWAAQQQEAVQTSLTEWKKASETDKEFGGEKLAENLAVAKKALDSFGSPELKKLLDDSGLGNHPEVIRAWFRIGKQVGEDTITGGSAGGKASSQDPAKILYPSMNQQS